MPRRERLIPFKMLPMAWGLSGRPRLEAEANYYLSGYDLDLRLAAIRTEDDPAAFMRAKAKIDLAYHLIDGYEHDMLVLHSETPNGREPDPRRMLEIKRAHDRIAPYMYDLHMSILDHPDGVARAIAKLGVELKHGKIDAYQHDVTLAGLHYPDDEVARKLALLAVDHAHGKIAKLVHDKESATLRNEPWVGLIDQDFDINLGVDGMELEFDWNKQWIDYLRMNGYTGQSEQDIVEAWFADVCRSPGGDETMSLPMASRRVPI